MLGPIGNARYTEYVDDILSSGQHLLSLINNILDMSKIESGSWRIQPEGIDPDEVLETRLRIFRERAIGRDRKSVVQGKSVSGRVDLGGRRNIKQKKNLHTERQHNMRTYHQRT